MSSPIPRSRALAHARRMPFCRIVRGPLGGGKTTVARAVGRVETALVVSIDRILEEEGLEEWDADRVSLRRFLRANDLAIIQARGNFDARRSTIVEGNFYWNEQVEDLFGRLPCPPLAVRLTAPVELCIARDAGRPEPAAEEGPRAREH